MQTIGRYANKSSFKEKRRKLRREQTKAEATLWCYLRDKRLDGKTKFRRQFSIGRYIVDFYCHELKLIIELDGDIHYYIQEKDKTREYYLRKQGYRIIRYTNEQIKNNLEGVLYNIIENINKLKSF